MLKKIAALALLAVGSFANAATYTATNSEFGIFDGSTGTRTVTIGSTTITDVNVSLLFAKCDDPALTAPGDCVGTGSPFLNEIAFALTSPSGTTINLIAEDTYWSGTGTTACVDLDDAAASPVGPALTCGTFRPSEALALFNGQDSGGTWTLLIRDTLGQDPLSFFSFTLNVAGSDVPEPASVALLGAGLAGLGFIRRRKARI